MTKFKGEVFMMKFVASAEKSETHSIIYGSFFKPCEIHIKTSHKRKENE